MEGVKALVFCYWVTLGANMTTVIKKILILLYSIVFLYACDQKRWWLTDTDAVAYCSAFSRVFKSELIFRTDLQLTNSFDASSPYTVDSVGVAAGFVEPLMLSLPTLSKEKFYALGFPVKWSIREVDFVATPDPKNPDNSIIISSTRLKVVKKYLVEADVFIKSSRITYSFSEGVKKIEMVSLMDGRVYSELLKPCADRLLNIDDLLRFDRDL